MFTGIIEATAAVIERSGSTLIVERPASFDDVKIGSSISVSGVCLSIIAFDAASMKFTMVEETLAKTNLGSLKKGDRVNLERAMRADARLDGHIVQGHVEGVAEVIAYEHSRLTVRIPASLVPFVIEKGSIALDGVSLTVASKKGDECTVALIPLTEKETTLGAAAIGDRVNIESDVLIRSSKTVSSF